jgi:hypothetical protein
VHLLGAPIHVFNKLEETRSESFNTQPEPGSTRQDSLESERALGNFVKHEGPVRWEKACLPNTRGLLVISGTIGTTYHRLGGKEQGGLP